MKKKIVLECYASDDIQYLKQNDMYYLTKPLKFIPFKLKYTENELKDLVNILLKGQQNLKITIEKAD